MKSRTVRTCERILRNLIEAYGPMARVGQPLIDKAIIEEAGGDSRTLKRYREHLPTLNFVLAQRDKTFTFNLKKVDYRQLALQESLLVSSEDEPP